MGREREDRGREGGEGRLPLMRSWNRAADWLRPALPKYLNSEPFVSAKHANVLSDCNVNLHRE